jgi:hypothetical protein
LLPSLRAMNEDSKMEYDMTYLSELHTEQGWLFCTIYVFGC